MGKLDTSYRVRAWPPLRSLPGTPLLPSPSRQCSLLWGTSISYIHFYCYTYYPILKGRQLYLNFVSLEPSRVPGRHPRHVINKRSPSRWKSILKALEQENFVVLRTQAPSYLRAFAHIVLSASNALPLSFFTWLSPVLINITSSEKFFVTIFWMRFCYDHLSVNVSHHWVFYYSDVLKNYRVFCTLLYHNKFTYWGLIVCHAKRFAFNFHNKPEWWIWFIFSFYRWGSWGSGTLRCSQ